METATATAVDDNTAIRLRKVKFDILTNGFNNNKIAKSNRAGKGYFTVILHFAPADNSGYEVCPMASAGCRKGCLYSAGNGSYPSVQAGRIKRTVQWYEQRDLCKARIVKDLEKLVKLCKEHNLIPAVRLNGTSDIRWESVWPEVFSMFPTVQWYDYTKDHNRFSYSHYLPTNYYLLYSRSEDNEAIALQLLEANRANVAVVFKGERPETWRGFPVLDGEQTDLRFLDEIKTGAVIGLKAKGAARCDQTGFVILN